MMTVNLQRLKRDLEELGSIGRDPRGGVTRPSFSRADFEARQWLARKFEKEMLAVCTDGAGNMSGRLCTDDVADRKAVLAGSHIDTVINAGIFDGTVGVLAALECVRRIREEGVRPAKPIEIIAFTDEEGNLVGDFLGSRAFTGRLNREEIEKGVTSFGRPLRDILAGTDFSVESILEAHRAHPPFDAYIEIHIEQGALLDTEEVPIGLVERIAGKHYYWCAFRGKAEHAGTTPLELRRDAFLGTADFALKATQHTATRHYGGMVTVGKVLVSPNAFSVVPGVVEFSLEFRSTAKETLLAMDRELLEMARNTAATRGLEFGARLVDATDPVELSPRIVAIVREECEKLGTPFMPMASGAGHDAQILAAAGETGMIFIPCIDGVSHSPDEQIRWEDLEKGANLLLAVLLRLAS